MKKSFIFLLLPIITILFIGCKTNMKEAELISRKVLFDNPDKASLRISPDGKYLSYLAPVNGVLNVWVAPKDDPSKAFAVTNDTLRGIRIYFWAYTNNRILYLQDLGGDENWQLHAVNIETKEDKNLTPFEEIPGPDGKPVTMPNGKKLRPTTRIQDVSFKFPQEILIGLNTRNPQYHDIYKINILNGLMTIVQQNDQFMNFNTDDNYILRYAMKMTADGGNEMFVPDGNGGWKSFDKIPMEDMMTTAPITFDKTGKILYMIDSRGRNTAALVSKNLETGENKIIYGNPKADLSSIMIHPVKKVIEAAASDYEKTEWTVLDESVKADLDYLNTLEKAEINVTDRTINDSLWTIAFTVDNGPVKYYLYDRAKKKASFLFTNRKDLEGLQLSYMNPVIIQSRDGLNLVSYLTLPLWKDPDNNARPNKPLPMVLLVHGGPWGRDDWGYNSLHQWLSNRGYAVLSVNFRGSTGFGKDFINAGNKEWAGKMQNDLMDAVNWAVNEGIADEQKVAIMGGSYGGYATLVGLTFTPKIFACGVDIVGPSNLITLLETIPPYWAPMIEMFATRMGDNRTEEGKKYLQSISPLSRVDSIQKPLLIGQGANDPRVKQTESDQIVKSMQEKKIPVTYVLFPDEGHGFARPENRIAFFAVTDLFLAEHLGGRSEAIGSDFKGSSVTVPNGADQIKSLSEALNTNK
ncbi:MAG: S9 family peptidase [Ignavibacteria bacterium]|nr:S9 family peptidase [Ignavibacteria bacterium]